METRPAAWCSTWSLGSPSAGTIRPPGCAWSCWRILWNPATGCSASRCRSGILSVAALLLGASEAVSVDIDRLARQNAQENAALSLCGKPLYRRCCEDLTAGEGRFRVVVANCLADVILRLTGKIEPSPERKDAVYLMGGIIGTRRGGQSGFEARQALPAGGTRGKGWVSSSRPKKIRNTPPRLAQKSNFSLRKIALLAWLNRRIFIMITEKIAPDVASKSAAKK